MAPFRRRSTRRYGRPKYRAHPYKKYKGKRYVKRFKPECKFFDNTSGGGAIGQYPFAWSEYYLSGILQGTTATRRVGNEAIIKSLGVTFDLNRNASGVSAQRVRWMVVRYVPSEGGNILPADMFQSTGEFLPQRSLQWIQDYQIVKAGMVTLDVASRNQKTVIIRTKINKKMKWYAGAGSYADQTSNSLFLLIWSDVATNAPTIQNLSWRLAFTDN